MADFPFPYLHVQCRPDGAIWQQQEADALVASVQRGDAAPTDLLIFCHGWNNNIPDAEGLYLGLASQLKPQFDSNSELSTRRFASCGILWPSRKFEEHDLIPSGAASLNDAVSCDLLRTRVGDLAAVYTGSEWPSGEGAETPPVFGQLSAAMTDIDEAGDEAQAGVVDLLRSAVSPNGASSDDGSDALFSLKSSVLLKRASRPLNPPPNVPVGGGTSLDLIPSDPLSTGTLSGLGGAAGYRDVAGGIKAGFLQLLNLTTYYVMKGRAGDVGEKGLAPLIVRVRDANPGLRIHLMGHSFGCRLIASALNALPDGDKYRPDTVFLLQGAFSHNGFAMAGDRTERGAFRDAIEHQRVRGPILISHSRNDKAVGIAYPLASRLSGVNAASVGGPDDIYGGLGTNGAQTAETTPERIDTTMLPVGRGADYPFAAGVRASTPCNLKADAYIGGHSDICKPEVGYAMTIGMLAPVIPEADEAPEDESPAR